MPGKIQPVCFGHWHFGKHPLHLWFTSTRRRRQESDQYLNSLRVRRLTRWRFNSSVRQRQGSAAESNPDYREKLPACDPERRRSIRLLKFQKESFWLDVSLCFFFCGNQSQRASQTAGRKLTFYIFQIIFAVILENMNFYVLWFLPENWKSLSLEV